MGSGERGAPAPVPRSLPGGMCLLKAWVVDGRVMVDGRQPRLKQLVWESKRKPWANGVLQNVTRAERHCQSPGSHSILPWVPLATGLNGDPQAGGAR